MCLPPCPALSMQLAAISLFVNTLFSLPVRWCCVAGVWRNGIMAGWRGMRWKWGSRRAPRFLFEPISGWEWATTNLQGSMCAEQDALYIVMHHMSSKVQREGMWVCACETESSGRTERESRWRWGWSESEKEMTSLRKCWAGFKDYWMEEVYSHSAPSLPLSASFLSSLSLSWDVQCRSCSHPYTVG